MNTLLIVVSSRLVDRLAVRLLAKCAKVNRNVDGYKRHFFQRTTFYLKGDNLAAFMLKGKAVFFHPIEKKLPLELRVGDFPPHGGECMGLDCSVNASVVNLNYSRS